MVDSIEREFYLTWEKDFSDKEVVITLIQEIKNGNSSIIYSYDKK